MTKGKLIFVSFMMAMLLPFCSGPGTKTTAKKNIDDHFKKFMTVEKLEEVGFQHLDGVNFFLLLNSKNIYIFNEKDFLIAKFTGNKLQRVFKTQKGQAPKEMITPMSFFLYNDDTIAIADYLKSSILFFDRDLNYTKEIKINNKIMTMARVGKTLVATSNYGGEENVFAVLDKDFNIVKTIVKANKKMPAERSQHWHLNKGFFLDEKLVSHSFVLFPNKKCKVDVYDVNTEKLVATLPWEQPFSPTAKSINERKNIYFIEHVGKYGLYYVVRTSHSKTLQSKSYHEFMIFDLDGTLKYKSDFSYGIIQAVKDTMDSKLYFMDDDEGISYIDIEAFLK